MNVKNVGFVFAIFMLFLIVFISAPFVFAYTFDGADGYSKVSTLSSCKKTQAYDQSVYFGKGFVEYVYNGSFVREGKSIKGDKFHCVYRNEKKYTGWYSYNCVEEESSDWWGLFKKGIVYRKKCSSGCGSSSGMCEAKNPAPMGYKILSDNDNLGGSCSNFGPFNATDAYPKIDGGADTFYFESAPGVKHVFCFDEIQDDISVGGKRISVSAGSYMCDSSNNMYYKKCDSGCSYTGFCGEGSDGKITHITYQNNPYLFSLSKSDSCFDAKDKYKDKYSCTVDNVLGTSWLWYCDGKKVYYMNCPKSSCTEQGCKLNKPFNGEEKISLDYSRTDIDFSKPISIIAESASGIAYIAYDFFLNGEPQNGWRYIFCDGESLCFKKLPAVTIDFDTLDEPTLIYLFYARSITGVWSNSEQIKKEKTWNID